MKKLFLFAVFLVMLAFPLPVTAANANAEELSYAVADGTEIWFYAEANEDSGLFIIPYTYYVVVLERGTPFCAVQYFDDVSPYKAIKGYCKTSDLTFVDFVPARPFLRIELTVSYRLAEQPSVSMGNGTFNTVDKTFVYYGTSYLGTARFHYVGSNGVFDYIPAAQDITYELNTDYLVSDAPVTSQDTKDPEETASSSAPSALQIVLICLTAAAVFAIAFFVLRGKKAPTRESEF